MLAKSTHEAGRLCLQPPRVQLLGRQASAATRRQAGFVIRRVCDHGHERVRARVRVAEGGRSRQGRTTWRDVDDAAGRRAILKAHAPALPASIHHQSSLRHSSAPLLHFASASPRTLLSNASTSITMTGRESPTLPACLQRVAFGIVLTSRRRKGRKGSWKGRCQASQENFA